MSIARLDALDDAHDLALVTVRLLIDSGNRTSLDEILETFGFTREELRRRPAYGE